MTTLTNYLDEESGDECEGLELSPKLCRERGSRDVIWNEFKIGIINCPRGLQKNRREEKFMLVRINNTHTHTQILKFFVKLKAKFQMFDPTSNQNIPFLVNIQIIHTIFLSYLK